MRSCSVLFVAVLAACGTTPDERPKTFEVVTFEVLAPHCGQVQCHSTFTATDKKEFDTLDGARAALMDLGVHSNPDGKGNTGELVLLLEGAPGYERMPPDVPLAKEDRELLLSWIVDENAVGL